MRRLIDEVVLDDDERGATDECRWARPARLTRREDGLSSLDGDAQLPLIDGSLAVACGRRGGAGPGLSRTWPQRWPPLAPSCVLVRGRQYTTGRPFTNGRQGCPAAITWRSWPASRSSPRGARSTWRLHTRLHTSTRSACCRRDGLFTRLLQQDFARPRARAGGQGWRGGVRVAVGGRQGSGQGDGQGSGQGPLLLWGRPDGGCLVSAAPAPVTVVNGRRGGGGQRWRARAGGLFISANALALLSRLYLAGGRHGPRQLVSP